MKIISYELKYGISGAIAVHILLFWVLYMQVMTVPKIETIISPSSLEVQLVSFIPQKKIVTSIKEYKQKEKIIKIPKHIQKDIQRVQSNFKNITPLKQTVSLELKERDIVENNAVTGAYIEAQQKKSQNQPPAYPHIARKRGYEGTVEIQLGITSDGKVNAIQIVKSSGFKILDQVAIKSVKKWKFQPAIRFGINVKSILEIQFVFKLNELKGGV